VSPSLFGAIGSVSQGGTFAIATSANAKQKEGFGTWIRFPRAQVLYRSYVVLCGPPVLTDNSLGRVYMIKQNKANQMKYTVFWVRRAAFQRIITIELTIKVHRATFVTGIYYILAGYYNMTIKQLHLFSHVIFYVFEIHISINLIRKTA